MTLSKQILCIGISMFLTLVSCKTDAPSSSDTNQNSESVSKELPKIPAINADSAYSFVDQQLSFGPRVPGSKGHEECKNWIVRKMQNYGLETRLQPFKATTYTGFSFDANNIIASYRPELKHRIVIACHWDTRFIADHDTDESRQDDPIMGADDGGSGVAVMIEMARVISEHPLDMGIDFVFFDAEDQGDSENNTPDTYCLGSQYWSKNLPSGYNPEFGILLDMVGAKGAIFRKEGFSMHYAPQLTDRIWRLAHLMGYGNRFPMGAAEGAITDDHYYVNKIAGIPMIDIINRPSSDSFGHYWHTHQDDIDIIDPQTLRMVGQIVTAALYKHSVGLFM